MSGVVMYQKNIKAYKANVLEAGMSVADPHRVIQLMMAGLLERLAMAKGAIDRKDFEADLLQCQSHKHLLMVCKTLDLSQGEISDRLYVLYDYMKDRLMDASINMDKQPIDEIANLMITIKSAWDKIPEEEKQRKHAVRQQKG